MDIGTAGLPIDLASTRDYGHIFSTLAAAGIDTFFPTSVYQEFPVKKGLGYEADFVPPPYGSASSDIYDLAREHGIKIAFSADLLFPLGQRIDPDDNPLKAIIDAGGGDVIHSIANYDEAAMRGIDPSWSQQVYDYVKSLPADIPVMQLHASVGDGDPAAYLDAVRAHAAFADSVGFNIYPIGDAVSGARTPYTPDRLLAPAEALGDYVDWLQAEFPDKRHTMVMQGFELADIYGDAAAAWFDEHMAGASRAPTMMELREMLIAVQEVDSVFWWGPSLIDHAANPIWQDILTVADMARSGNLNTALGALTDSDADRNVLAEDAEAGAYTGVTLFAPDPDALDSVTYTVDDERFEVTDGARLTVAEGAKLDFETEASITLEATARSTDGTVSRMELTLEVTDVIDRLIGTDAADRLTGGEGVDVIEGHAGDDAIVGREGADTIDGGAGSDWVYGGEGADVIDGGTGADILIGDSGDDTIRGGGGDDIIVGGTGDDLLEGNDGFDQIFAEGGADTLIGGRGGDMLMAGYGADTFEFRVGDGADHVFDFDVSQDSLRFTGGLTRADLDIGSYASATMIGYEGGLILLHDIHAGMVDDLDFVFG
ncbi:hypothetical protein D6850_07725 [Roseovarius spongiae]|uniref:Cadherin domain-containing protein n=1 Tax=Roseovarius spongiae TaxID=2320272 RepID=A0A3A8AVX4_9RHOB|nr:calcium-binding protein [Roseovarius spongiae]RKF14760.1 hypothetical protein D6850_07725 [Roseovarius spongiae]